MEAVNTNGVWCEGKMIPKGSGQSGRTESQKHGLKVRETPGKWDLALSWDFSCSFPGQKSSVPKLPGGKNLCGFTGFLKMGRRFQVRGDRVNCENQAGLELCYQHWGVLWSLGLMAHGQPGNYSQLMECAGRTFPTPTLCLADGFFWWFSAEDPQLSFRRTAGSNGTGRKQRQKSPVKG